MTGVNEIDLYLNGTSVHPFVCEVETFASLSCCGTILVFMHSIIKRLIACDISEAAFWSAQPNWNKKRTWNLIYFKARKKIYIHKM